MRTESRGETLRIFDIPALNSDYRRLFKEYALGALKPEHTCVEVDLGDARMVDSEGIGALISVHKVLCNRGGKVRLHKPLPMIADMFKLLQLDQLFEITPR